MYHVYDVYNNKLINYLNKECNIYCVCV